MTDSNDDMPSPQDPDDRIVRRDDWFEELFEYQTYEDSYIGDANKDENAEQLLGTHLGIDFVANPGRRSGKPTVAGTRLEPHIIGERIFNLTLRNLRSTMKGQFDTEMFKDIRNHYAAHPHDVPQIKPRSPSWFEQFKLRDEIPDFYAEQAQLAYKLAVIDMAQRRDYTFPRMIDAMCEFYDANREHMEFLRRSDYDASFCMGQLGETDDPIVYVEDKSDTEGHFVATNGDVFDSFANFLREQWDREWPPDDPLHIDHQATFGVDRPPELPGWLEEE